MFWRWKPFGFTLVLPHPRLYRDLLVLKNRVPATQRAGPCEAQPPVPKNDFMKHKELTGKIIEQLSNRYTMPDPTTNQNRLFINAADKY